MGSHHHDHIFFPNTPSCRKDSATPEEIEYFDCQQEMSEELYTRHQVVERIICELPARAHHPDPVTEYNNSLQRLTQGITHATLPRSCHHRPVHFTASVLAACPPSSVIVSSSRALSLTISLSLTLSQSLCIAHTARFDQSSTSLFVGAFEQFNLFRPARHLHVARRSIFHLVLA